MTPDGPARLQVIRHDVTTLPCEWNRLADRRATCQIARSRQLAHGRRRPGRGIALDRRARLGHAPWFPGPPAARADQSGAAHGPALAPLTGQGWRWAVTVRLASPKARSVERPVERSSVSRGRDPVICR